MDRLLLAKEEGRAGHRVFYFAIPPSVFVDVARAVHNSARAKTGWTRVVVEKPFGRDFESSAELSRQIGALFSEEEIYRIDHYLGKEMVQNLMNVRFANVVFEPLWNRFHIANVQITFKEDIGTQVSHLTLVLNDSGTWWIFRPLWHHSRCDAEPFAADSRIGGDGTSGSPVSRRCAR